jgi:hypothetical protein
MCLYQGMLILYQSYHDDYVYPGDKFIVSDGNGMTFNTRVPAVVIISLNWLVWSVVRFWVKLW